MNTILNNHLEKCIDKYVEGINKKEGDLYFFAIKRCMEATLGRIPEYRHAKAFDEDTLRITKEILNGEEFIWYGTLYSR